MAMVQTACSARKASSRVRTAKARGMQRATMPLFQPFLRFPIPKTTDRLCIKDGTTIDPASGSGNFLTETYVSIRRLENEAISAHFGGQMTIGDVSNQIQVSIRQFHGIEINDFAVTIAKTALWVAESQMMRETENILYGKNLEFLPLKTNARCNRWGVSLG